MSQSNTPDVPDGSRTLNGGSLQQPGSVVVAEIRCEGRTMDELADRIARVAGAVRNGTQKFRMASKHSRCEVKPITEPPNIVIQAKSASAKSRVVWA